MKGVKPSCIVSSSKFTWKIQNFSRLSEEKIYSDIFIVGDCKWRLLIFPKGDNADGFLSIFLDVADAKDLPNRWNRLAKCRFSVINTTETKETHNVFNARTRYWGYKYFIPVRKIKDPAKGYLVKDTLTCEVEVHVLKARHSSKDNEKNVTKDVSHVQTSKLLAELSNMRDKQSCFTLDSIQAPETANFQQQKEALRIFFSMSLEAIQQADCFLKIEEGLNALVKNTTTLKEKTSLENIISRFTNVKTNVHNAIETAETAKARRASLAEKTADIDSKLEEREEELSSLEFEFSTLSGEKEKLRAEIDKVTARMKSVSVKLERANEETCKEMEARRNLEAETKKVIAEWVGAKEKLAAAKVHWDLLREDLGLAKLH